MACDREPFCDEARERIAELERELSQLRAALSVLEFGKPADAFYNLMGARIDIEEGRGDKICNDTLRRVEKQLGQLSAALIRAEGR